MLNRTIVQRRIESLLRQENMLIKAMHDCPHDSAPRQRLAVRLVGVQGQLVALEWATGDYTWPSSRSEAATKRLIREE
jgi:hypothetical protein